MSLTLYTFTVAFLTVGLVIIATLTINSRLPPRKVERIFDFRPLREKGFLLVTIGEAIIMVRCRFVYARSKRRC
jgi:Tfp pilus assembly ATPase PilU